MTDIIYCTYKDRDFKIEAPKCSNHSEEFVRWRKKLSEIFSKKECY